MKDIKLPTYIINLPSRDDRRKHIEAQFENKKEFDITIVDAIEHSDGAYGLWQSIVKVIKIAQEAKHDRIVFCEDDYIFTRHYRFDYLLDFIKIANEKSIELLIGGVSGFGTAIPIARHLYWVDWHWGNQFLIIDKSLYQRIIDYDFKIGQTAEDVLAHLTHAKAVIYPFISIQKEIGKSNISLFNSRKGVVSTLFAKAQNLLAPIHHINHIFNYNNK